MHSVLARHFVLRYVPLLSLYFFILNVFDSRHVGYCLKQIISLFLSKNFDQVCGRVNDSPNPTFLY